MAYTKIDYSSLNPKQQEIFNFQKISSKLADYWFNCIKLGDDWQWADFLAYHINWTDTLKVQLKWRLTIDKKYIWKNIFMWFPISWEWYMIKHDELISIIKKTSSWLESDSWTKWNWYSSWKPNKNILHALHEYKL